MSKLLSAYEIYSKNEKEILNSTFKEEERTNDMLNAIILEIKKINDIRRAELEQTISEDESNEELKKILSEYGLEDAMEELEDVFGLDGLHKIRNAEEGIY